MKEHVGGLVLSIAIAAASFFIGGLVSHVTNQQQTTQPRTCVEYRSQEAAQKALRSGALRLDKDKDGIACESLYP